MYKSCRGYTSKEIRAANKQYRLIRAEKPDLVARNNNIENATERGQG